MRRYYAILGLPENANLQEVKKAYRKLAFVFHPDHNKNPQATKRFIEINEAYERIIKTHENIFIQGDDYKRQHKSEGEINERMRWAKERYEQIKREAALQDNLYYQSITSGTKFKRYLLVASCSALLGMLLAVDGFLPGKMHACKIDTVQFFKTYHGLHYKSVLKINLFGSGESYWVNYDFANNLIPHQQILIEKSRIFHDALSVADTGKSKIGFSRIDYSIQGVYPSVSILLFFPFFLLFFRSRTFLYSILFQTSYYASILGILFILLSNYRIAHLFSLGIF
jgi:hypothetical protein